MLPNKKKGFAECHRLLKSGGIIAVCTAAVIKDKLEDAGVLEEWPLCMQTFARMEELEPMLQDLGSFEDIEIDLSDSLLEIPEPDEEDQEGDMTVNVRKLY